MSNSPYRSAIEVSTDHHRCTLAQTERELRELVSVLGMHARDASQPNAEVINRNEAIAQATIALRHIEDARMRLGKVMQYALQGGVSKYEQEG